jgi:Sortase domain
MRDRYVRRAPAPILIVAGLLLALNVCSPRFAQATRQVQATYTIEAASTVTPGPTTPPMTVTITGSNSPLCYGSLATLTITNTYGPNTPADTTLIVNFPDGMVTNSYTVTTDFPSTPAAPANGSTISGFMLHIGALEVGAGGHVTIAVQPRYVPGDGNLGRLLVWVQEVGDNGTDEQLSNNYFLNLHALSCPPPTETPTDMPSATATPTSLPPSTQTPTPTATQTPTQTPVPPSPTTTPQDAAVVAPSTTPVVPPSATPAIAPSTTPIVTYKTLTRYRTVTHTLLRYKVVYRTVVRYKTVVRRKVVSVYAVRVVQQPKTGRFAAPPSQEHRTAMPRPDAYMSVPRLGISSAPVWTRGYVADGDGGFTYDIVPFYGVTRFAYSVPFGLPGTTLAYGHDDIDGSIFRYLARLKVGDAIGVAVGRRRLTYIVRSVSTVSPTDVRLLTQPRLRPTLALISCTPWGVDTRRVVVIAEIQTRGGKAL